MSDYQLVRRNLLPEEVAQVINSIQSSCGIYELDDLSHIVEVATGNKVGYIGNDTLELVDTHDPSLTADHSLLWKIYENIEPYPDSI